MCGLAGCIGSVTSQTLNDVGKLLKDIEHRGQDATGIALLDLKSTTVRKWALPASIAIRQSNFNPGNDSGFGILGHVRHATHGLPEDMSNNHPIVDGPITLTHNGIISNWKDLRDLYGSSAPSNDSASIAGSLAALPTALEPRTFTMRLEEVRGSFALVVHDQEVPALVWFATHGNPIWFARLESEKQLWYCSELQPLENLLGSPWYFYRMPRNTWLAYDATKKQMHSSGDLWLSLENLYLLIRFLETRTSA